jgi:hypothetical protein
LWDVVAHLAETDSFIVEGESWAAWHNALCQAMEDPIVLVIAHSMYNVAESLIVNDDPVYEVAVTHLARWMDPFDSLVDIEDNVYWTAYWLRAAIEV